MIDQVLFGIFLVLFSIAFLKMIVIDCNVWGLIWYPVAMYACGFNIIGLSRGLW